MEYSLEIARFIYHKLKKNISKDKFQSLSILNIVNEFIK